MKLKTILKTVGLLLVISSIALVYLANRDITKIYGGLTERVDPESFATKSGNVLINNVSVLSVNADRFIANQSVLIRDGQIASIQSSAQPTADEFKAEHIINGAGKYLIPGLIDSHVHLFKSQNDLLLYAANGVTHIREMIGEPDHLKWRNQIKEGGLGPDLFIASPRIGSFGALEGFFMEWSQGFLNITNAEDAVEQVQSLHQQGYDGVKIYSQINRETYFAVSNKARELGMRVVGHVPWEIQMDDVYQNQQEVAHLEELMNAMNREFGNYSYDDTQAFLEFVNTRSDEISAELAKHDIAVTTVLWLVESFVRQKFELAQVLSEVELEFENPGISEWTPRVPQGGLGWLPGVNRYQYIGERTEQQNRDSRLYWQTYAKACQIILRSLIKHDVSILAGTDTNLPPTVPGFSLHDEFLSMHKAGMSPAQILKSATLEPAKWLGINAGQVSAGYKANLVLLNENPLDNIANTNTVQTVLLNGHLIERSVLDSILSEVKAANDASRTRDISEYTHEH